MKAPSLGPWTFGGEVTVARERQTSVVGEASFDGVIAWAAWPRAQVARLLPPELELARSSAGPSDEHPVLVAMGRQEDTAVVYGGVRFDVAIGYDECLLSVPFVCRRGRTQMHTFVALMLSGDRRATWSGNTHYGFAKRAGRCERFGDVVNGVADDAGLLMCAAIQPGEGWARGRERSESVVTTIPRVFDAPVMGRRADGSYVASYFTWNLDEAMVRPSNLSLFLAPSVGLEPAEVRVPADAGFEVRGMRWALGWPEHPIF